jgi:hypothetical protein
MAERTEKKAKYVSDWANCPARPESSSLEQRQKLWEALAKFIHSHGGWVTSLPNKPILRIEIPQGSALPSKLMELGYSPWHCGTKTRLVSGGMIETITVHSTTGEPISRRHDGIIAVDIIEIEPGQ